MSKIARITALIWLITLASSLYITLEDEKESGNMAFVLIVQKNFILI
ncbi:exported hypothetical protein [Desulfamplus magnetovallimortis]|uniref:Uncharacterized protein n=1 Tax=Desulfamplus magnetovallimortis TaxID=1246637 RepID=A0A1W1H7B1_9BACT|nr:hypothetical protein [Desulfamplus magnetovallimortis]SLM28362.1 exported hypothetical protein [Desulfamplus magnetovallimortis]